MGKLFVRQGALVKPAPQVARGVPAGESDGMPDGVATGWWQAVLPV